jgi:predicted flap endonuclease-1-like 5' DNA nuclease
MGKKDKMGVNKLFERVENLVSDALKRIDNLQNQVHELREQVMERVGLAEKAPKKSAKSSSTTAKPASKPASSGSSTTQKKSSGGSTAKKSTGTKSGSSTKKAASGSKSSGAKKKDDLTQIKGVGPATAKKMQAKGITSINQIANPSADDQKKLEEFKKLKSFSSWQAEAKKLV